MSIQHNVPTLEERMATLSDSIVKYDTMINDTEKALVEGKKEFNSMKLKYNELNLIKNIKDGKFVVFDKDTLTKINFCFV